MTTVCFLCALAAHFGWDVHQSDNVIAFLNGDIFEEVYVTQPRGFVKKGQEDKVCKCHTALYGLKQSPRAWYEKADTHLVKRGFHNSPTERTLYVKRELAMLLEEAKGRRIDEERAQATAAVVRAPPEPLRLDGDDESTSDSETG
ncbi:hypothetical protein L7F22_050373 [Adiantum nelumboides]|nr:hypothetical protein [Adiantum nelumboides]